MGLYAVEQDLIDWIGETNLREISNIDNESNDINSIRVDKAIARGQAKINNKFRTGFYAIPFAFGDDDAREQVTEWNVVLAVVWLWRGRRINSPNNTKKSKANAFEDNEKRVKNEMNSVLAGSTRLNATSVEDDHPTAPVVVF